MYLEAQTLFEDIQLMPREIVDFVGQRGGAVVYITLLYQNTALILSSSLIIPLGLLRFTEDFY